MGKPELSLDTEWVCVIVGRLQVGPPFRRTLSSQSRRLSCRGRRPERTTKNQKEPPRTKKNHQGPKRTTRDQRTMDFQGLPKNCRGFSTGREHVQNPKWSENPKQKPEPKHKIDDDVLGVGSCNIELLSVPSNNNFQRKSRQRSLLLFKMDGRRVSSLSVGSNESEGSGGSRIGENFSSCFVTLFLGDPKLVRLFHPVLSHIFGGPELVRLFVANIWTTNQV